ncbi:hypothetical protein CRE_23498 [Caenorhabditis remanei]|uniref:Uncharacterized protein n=1 Tax=Caenorhabditis remanei TaxID=31234 RepID=E3MH10_CAERE|nr:hypothetical protein CRE_23498 [Caenorhabditis remanei]
MGYAPNDRSELLEKEIKIKNKSLIIAQWFGNIYVIYMVTLLLVLPAAAIVDRYRTVEGVPEFEVNNIFYFFWFLFLYIACVTFLTPVFAVFLPRKYFKVAYYFTYRFFSKSSSFHFSSSILTSDPSFSRRSASSAQNTMEMICMKRVQLDGLTKSELDSCMYTMLYVLIHIIIVMILIVVLTLLLPQRHFKIGFYFTIAQSFLLVFWIIQFNKMFIYGSKVDQIRQQFIFTIFAQIVAIPLLFGTTYICSQVFLQFSKLHPEYEGDNLYEVIYGGDDSSTKKIDIS